MAPPTAYPRYYDLDHVPVRVRTARSVPEIYRGGGKWEPFADDPFHDGKPLAEAEFTRLIAAFDADRKR